MSRWTVVNLPGCQWRASLRLGLPLVLTLFTALSALALNNQLKAQYDSGVYVVLATSLSMGQGYRDIFVLGDPPHTKYPPVFPLLLAPFIHAFGYNVVLLKLMVIAMAVSALYVLYRLYADEGDQGMPLVLALAAATSPGVVFFSQSVMTEVPYLLLSLLALLALHRYSPPASGAALAIIAGLLSLAYLTRLVGLSLLVAAVAYLLCEGGAPTRSARRRDAIVIGLLAAVPAAAWFLRSWWVGESAAPVYLSEFNIERAWSSPTSPGGMLDLARRASRNIVRYAGHVGRVIFFYAPLVSPTFLPALLASLTLLGFLRCIVRRRTVIEYYVFVYVGVLLLYPATHLQRYVVPVIPFLWFYFFVSLGWLAGGLARVLAGFPPVLRDAGRIGAVTLVSALLVANATAAVLDNVVRPSRERYYRPGGDEAYVNVLPWVTAHTPPDAVFLWAKASLRYPWSGRKSATIRPTGDPDAMLRSILESKIDYAVIDSFSKGARRYLQPAVEKHPEHFRLVHQNDVSAVYQVIRTP